MAHPLLAVENVRTVFPVRGGFAPVVDGVTFSLEEGRTLCVVGESGCGKSVTALSIMRLIDAQVSGSIRLHGRDLLTLSEREMQRVRGGNIAMIFQEPGTSLNPVQSIGSQIEEAMRLHRSLSRRERKAEILRLLDSVKIPNPPLRARQFPHELSGGMKQRAMIALALAGEPKLLIADEPTTALDVTVQSEILSLLRTIQAERKLSMLFITHDLGVVAEMAHEVAVMYAGKVVEIGSVREIIDRPRHPYTHALLQSVPRMNGPKPTQILEGVVPLPGHWPTGCRFADRCRRRDSICDQDPSPLIGKQSSACWKPIEGPSSILGV